MGSFPIQSWTSCANEWVADGETGFLVPPEDPEVVEQAIRKALTDDALVDRAAEANYHTIAGRAEYRSLRRKTIEMYQYVYNRTLQS
jgi:glycosyltransferase involved in cell wall biosynthesis